MSTPSASTVLKAFDVLSLFIERQTLGASEAAQLLNAPRASTHRMLVTLRTAGVLEVTESGQYQLSMRLFELGCFAPLRRGLHEAAMRPILRLAAFSQLPVQLAVREGNEVLYLERVGYRKNNLTPVGERGPLHATGVGKVLLAFAPPCFRETYFAAPLSSYTEHTLTSPERLTQELAQVRRRGVAYGRQERHDGYYSVARPVRDHQREVVASVSIVAAEPFKDRLGQFEIALEKTCRDIENQLLERWVAREREAV
ncbi:MAG: IclR family transcriptional regulator [Actinobacteria bacterium]|jgi:DNA-binding IclR family transcriptional regulator|nr:IclR family transcriptional regulator [Actinomycetota bacterium]